MTIKYLEKNENKCKKKIKVYCIIKNVIDRE
jgi:hypothetical protein